MRPACDVCGSDGAPVEVLVRVAPRRGPRPRGSCVVFDDATAKDISGLVPITTPLVYARAGQKIDGRLYTSDPAHLYGPDEVCARPATYVVVAALPLWRRLIEVV